MNRALITCLVIVAYLLSFNLYIYMLANGMLGQSERRLMYYYITGAMTLFCWIDLKNITHVLYHWEFNKIAFSSLMANFVLNLLNHHGLFDSNGAIKFIVFNGLIFALTLSILISGVQHGYFKNKYENE